MLAASRHSGRLRICAVQFLAALPHTHWMKSYPLFAVTTRSVCCAIPCFVLHVFILKEQDVCMCAQLAANTAWRASMQLF
jgi:hypothetical protein